MGAATMPVLRNLAAVVIGASALGFVVSCSGGPLNASGAPMPVSPPPQHTVHGAKGGPQAETVMTIGSSVAAGWGDAPGMGGYLARAFRSLSAATKTNYRLASFAFGGVTGTQIANQFPKWLARVNPAVVAISWGGMDDLVAGTPMSTFESVIKTEIDQVLAIHAVVMIVTPPVTAAAAVNGLHKEPYLYFQAEIKVAQAMDNPNVHVFDVFDQMWNYLQQNHLSYTQFMADGWHPNAAGHALAGHFLFKDMLGAFGTQPIQFVASSSPAG